MLWKEKYKLGIENIDHQHKELFDRVGEFLKVIKSDGEWETKLEKVKETLEFMKEYVITHFDSEEAYLKEIGFPEYEEHKAIHEDFKAKVTEYAQKFEEENYDEELVQEFGGMLMAWLINHVASTDQKIAEYVESTAGGEDNES